MVELTLIYATIFINYIIKQSIKYPTKLHNSETLNIRCLISSSVETLFSFGWKDKQKKNHTSKILVNKQLPISMTKNYKAFRNVIIKKCFGYKISLPLKSLLNKRTSSIHHTQVKGKIFVCVHVFLVPHQGTRWFPGQGSSQICSRWPTPQPQQCQI